MKKTRCETDRWTGLAVLAIAMLGVVVCPAGASDWEEDAERLCNGWGEQDGEASVLRLFRDDLFALPGECYEEAPFRALYGDEEW